MTKLLEILKGLSGLWDVLKTLASKLNSTMAMVVMMTFIIVAGSVTAYYFYTKVEIARTVTASTTDAGKVAYGIETDIPVTKAGSTKQTGDIK